MGRLDPQKRSATLIRWPDVCFKNFTAPGSKLAEQSRIESHFHFKGSRKNNFTFLCADASCLAVLPKRRNISICLRFGALPGRRLNT
jgi:hypothetical protein